MHKPIRRVGVIGAGVMGSGIAAHLANAGVEVAPPRHRPARPRPSPRRASRAARNRFAAGGLEKALKARPAAFFHPSFARLVEIGNVEDDLAKLADCDLVIEAIIEKLEPKRALFEKLEKLVRARRDRRLEHARPAHRRHDAGPLRGLQEALPRDALLQPRPLHEAPRARRRPGHGARDVLARVRRFGEDVLGKGIVIGKDTPNFVGNRIGTHAMMAAIHQMLADGLAPEDVDAITGRAMGAPEERELPHRRHRRPRHPRPRRRQLLRRAHAATRSARSSRCPATSARWSRRSSSATRPRAASTARAKDGRSRRSTRRRSSTAPKGGDEAIRKAVQGASRRSRTRRARVKKLVARPGQGGAVRVEGDLALARVRGAPHRRDRRRRGGDR